MTVPPEAVRGRDLPVRRGFVAAAGRRVHYRCAGSGPPVVLLHDSPRSSVLHLPLLRALSGQFTVFALDTPGYGQSDPLPAEPRPEIDDFGDALAAALEALGLERPAVYAYHTSSKIALSCAVRHPGRIGRLVVDGLSLPAEPVPEAFIEAYMRPFTPDADGAYIAQLWTRIRDLHRFFPWFDRRPAARIEMDEPPAGTMHAYAMDLFMAGPHYASAYSAAMRYRAAGVLTALATPTTFLARANDVLYPYLDVLERLSPPGAAIERLPADDVAWRARLREVFASAGGTAAPPPPTGLAAGRGYLDFDHGQLHLRCVGQGPADLVVLHDPPGSGQDAAPPAEAIPGCRALLPDLPGCGLSDPLGDDAGCEAYASVLAGMADRLGIRQFTLAAHGLAVPIAVELAHRQPGRVRQLVLDGMPPMTPDRAREVAAHYAPPIAPARDGSHFHATWHRLRDEQLQWPWYDGSFAARRTIPPELDAWRLHERLVATLLQPEAYGQACRAALAYDLVPRIRGLTVPLTLLEAAGDPRYAGVAGLVAARSGVTLVPRPTERAATWELLAACATGAA